MVLNALSDAESPLQPQPWPLGAGDPGDSPFPQPAPAAERPLVLLVDRRGAAFTPAWRQRLRQSLSAAELERLQRFRLPRDAERFLLGRGLMRAWLAQILGCGAAELPFTALAHGKPVVAGAPHFNVSHSGDLILLALHADRAVGVDLERDRTLLDWPAIARRYLGVAALQQLRRDHPDAPSQRRAFLLEWCRLEARLKADGRGLSGLSDLLGSRRSWADECWPLPLPEGYQGAAALQPAALRATALHATALHATAPHATAVQSHGLESRAGAPDQGSGGRASASTASGAIHIASP
jgi:4'-phosphopantetheinyl transferase